MPLNHVFQSATELLLSLQHLLLNLMMLQDVCKDDVLLDETFLFVFITVDEVFTFFVVVI